MNRDVTLLVAGALIAASCFGAGFTVGKSSSEVKVVTAPATAPIQAAIAETQPAQPVEAVPAVAEQPAEPAAPASEVRQVSFNTSSKKYHEPTCKWAGCGNCEATTLDSALSQGGVPCKVCH